MTQIVLAQGSDLFSRLSQFSSEFPAWVLLLGVFFLVATVQLALSKHVFWLIPTYLLMCMFSGHIVSQLDTGTTLIRWWLILCFCIAALKMGSYPGSICIMLGTYWLFSLFSTLWSPNFGGGIQLAGLSVLMTLGASTAISGIMANPAIIMKTLNLYALMSVVFILNGLVSIGNLSGSRFAGAMGEAVGLFVITGGLLMPTLLWAFLTKEKSLRLAAGLGFILVSALCATSGQRAGFFAGAISCLPLLFQLNSKFFARSLVVISVAVIFSTLFIQLFPQQSEFVVKRYFDTDKNGNMSLSIDTTGRNELWNRALKRTMEKPIVGFGAAADKRSNIGGFHNAYLQEWYNGGVIGLFLFLGASLVALYKTFRLTQLKHLDDEIRQYSRLLFSWMIVLFLTSFFESKLASPSNIMAFTMVLIGVMTHRLELHAKSIQHEQLYSQRI